MTGTRSTRTTREVVSDHLDRRAEGDLDADLRRNYAEEVVVLTTGEGVLRGWEGIRGTASVLRGYDVGQYVYDVVLVEGEHALLAWHSREGAEPAHDGADSFVVRDGRIVAQTIHYSVRRPAGG